LSSRLTPASGGGKAIGLFDWIKRRAQLEPPPTEEVGEELGDFVEPGSSVEVAGMSFSSAGGAAGLEQLKGLHASGLIDADTLELIEATMTNPAAQLDRLHASGLMSDESYAEAKASIAAATSGPTPAESAAELDLLLHGDSAPATILALPEPDDGDTRPQLKLEVHPATGSPYTVECPIGTVPPGAEPKVGHFLPVKIDPNDPKRVAIDWTGFGS